MGQGCLQFFFFGGVLEEQGVVRGILGHLAVQVCDLLLQVGKVQAGLPAVQ